MPSTSQPYAFEYKKLPASAPIFSYSPDIVTWTFVSLTFPVFVEMIDFPEVPEIVSISTIPAVVSMFAIPLIFIGASSLAE